MPFQIVRNDIATMKVDAIVNAANSQLAMGGGVCGAIFKGAGARRMKRACNEIGSCQTGRAVYTPGFDLDAKYVIHAVGPVWEGGNSDEEELLTSAYTQALRTAASLGAHSIALPLISAGSFGYPVDQAYDVAVKTIRTFLERHDIMVYLVVFSDAATQLARAIPNDLQEFIDSTYVDEAEAAETRAFQRGRHARAAHVRIAEDLDATFSLEEDEKSEADEVDAMRFDPQTGEPIDISRRAKHRVISGKHGRSATPDSFAPSAAPAFAAAPSGVHAAPASFDLAEREAAPKMGAIRAEEAIDEELAILVGSDPAAEASMPLDDVLKHLDESFSTTLLRLIDDRDLSDAAVYKRANISRQLFAKIRKDDDYRPSKPTVLALAVALEMNLEDTEALLKRAGFSLSHSSKFDVIVEYFLRREEHDIFTINESLYAYDQPLLGSASM